MKFTKLNLNECLLSVNTQIINDSIQYYNSEGKILCSNIGDLSIGISYYIPLDIRKKRRNNLKYSDFGKIVIFKLEENEIKENNVYIYNFLGILINEKTQDYEYTHTFPGYIAYFNEETDKYLFFNNELYYINIEKDKYRYNNNQIKILLKEFIYKENNKFEKLKREIELFEKLNKKNVSKERREPIPEEVKFEVWRRDEGKCVLCGSNKRLEFDHIIPFSKGGGNTTRNIQLLCEACNRKKSNII